MINLYEIMSIKQIFILPILNFPKKKQIKMKINKKKIKDKKIKMIVVEDIIYYIYKY